MEQLHHHTNSDDEEESFRPFKWPERMIGRDEEWRLICSTLEAQPFQPQIFYFQGKGGIGKTRLLRETTEFANRLPHVLTTKVIDLYHFRYHLPLMMMTTIAQQLEESLRQKGDTRPAFTEFSRKLANINKVASNGSSVAIEAEVRLHLTRAFVKDYTKLTTDFVIVLVIDTFEKLDPSIEETKAFNFRASHFEDWIVQDFLPLLPRTLTLVAGRENERQKHILPAHVRQLAKLTKEQTREFIEASLNEQPADHVVEQLHDYADGRPVLLSLGLAYLQIENMELPLVVRGETTTEGHINENLLITNIIKSLQEKKQHIASLLIKAYFLRKGLHRDLVALIDNELEEEQKAQVERRIEYYAQLPFFKRTGPRNREVSLVVLHDEMYDRFYGYLPPTYAREIYDQAIDYIQGLIDKKLEELEYGSGEGQNWLAVSDEEVRNSTRLQTAQEIRLMRVEQLFYKLARHPLHGYHHYRRLSHIAIQAHDEDFDTLLRGELARFFEVNPELPRSWGQENRQQLDIEGISWDQVLFEDGVRWVERRLNAYLPGRDRYTDALHLADQVEQTYDQVYKNPTNPLPRYSLEAARLRAKMYLSRTVIGDEDIRQTFTTLVTDMERWIEQLTTQGAAIPDDDRDLHADEIRYAQLLLATLYNDFGYYERMHERYHSAAEKYTRSLRLYSGLGPEANGLRAVVLTNLAFARHQQGFSKAGLTLVDAALELAKKYGSPQQMATTRNMSARLQLRVNSISVHKAYISVSKARTIFYTLKSGRGSALCALTEGNVLCARASYYALSTSGRRARNLAQARQDYEHAIARYRYAMDKFDERPSDHQEPQSDVLRRIEARVGMGAVYRERGLLQRQEHILLEGCNPDTDLQHALDLAQDAWRLCNEEVPRVTRIAILEDMAFVHIERDEFDTARDKLYQARKLIPANYRIDEQTGIHYQPGMEEHWTFWFRLSQIELQESLIAFRNRSTEEGCKRLLRSFACLHTFSPFAPLRHSLRKLGKRGILSAVPEAGQSEAAHVQLATLRDVIHAEARRLHIPQTVLIELEELFDELEGLARYDA